MDLCNYKQLDERYGPLKAKILNCSKSKFYIRSIFKIWFSNHSHISYRQAAEAERRRTEAEEAAKNAENTTDVEVEYIQEKLELDMSDPAYRQFSRIFEGKWTI